MDKILYTISIKGKTIANFIDRDKAISEHNKLKITGAKLISFNTESGKKKYINR